jgi:hypothetical protein
MFDWSNYISHKKRCAVDEIINAICHYLDEKESITNVQVEGGVIEYNYKDGKGRVKCENITEMYNKENEENRYALLDEYVSKLTRKKSPCVDKNNVIIQVKLIRGLIGDEEHTNLSKYNSMITVDDKFIMTFGVNTKNFIESVPDNGFEPHKWMDDAIANLSMEIGSNFNLSGVADNVTRKPIALIYDTHLVSMYLSLPLSIAHRNILSRNLDCNNDDLHFFFDIDTNSGIVVNSKDESSLEYIEKSIGALKEHAYRVNKSNMLVKVHNNITYN